MWKHIWQQKIQWNSYGPCDNGFKKSCLTTPEKTELVVKCHLRNKKYLTSPSLFTTHLTRKHSECKSSTIAWADELKPVIKFAITISTCCLLWAHTNEPCSERGQKGHSNKTKEKIYWYIQYRSSFTSSFFYGCCFCSLSLLNSPIIRKYQYTTVIGRPENNTATCF